MSLFQKANRKRKTLHVDPGVDSGSRRLNGQECGRVNIKRLIYLILNKGFREFIRVFGAIMANV